MRVRYSDRSRDDLIVIRASIARDSAYYAKRIIQGIRVAIRQLRSFPELGGRVDAWHRDDLRELVVGNYRIIYQVTGREVWIITVLHAARMLPKSPEI